MERKAFINSYKYVPNFLTAKIPMRLLAILVILFLVGATILYFYDVLYIGLLKLHWYGKKLVSEQIAEVTAAAMAITIGIGVLAESAPTIWDKLIFWGQIIDNKIKNLFCQKEYFLETVDKLLNETQKLFGVTNFNLQAIAIPTDEAPLREEDINSLWIQIKKIKDNCKAINYILENHQAEDTLHIKKQQTAKRILDEFITANLEMSSWVEHLSGKLKNKIAEHQEDR